MKDMKKCIFTAKSLNLNNDAYKEHAKYTTGLSKDKKLIEIINYCCKWCQNTKTVTQYQCFDILSDINVGVWAEESDNQKGLLISFYGNVKKPLRKDQIAWFVFELLYNKTLNQYLPIEANESGYFHSVESKHITIYTEEQFI